MFNKAAVPHKNQIFPCLVKSIHRALIVFIISLVGLTSIDSHSFVCSSLFAPNLTYKNYLLVVKNGHAELLMAGQATGGHLGIVESAAGRSAILNLESSPSKTESLIAALDVFHRRPEEFPSELREFIYAGEMAFDPAGNLVVINNTSSNFKRDDTANIALNLIRKMGLSSRKFAIASHVRVFEVNASTPLGQFHLNPLMEFRFLFRGSDANHRELFPRVFDAMLRDSLDPQKGRSEEFLLREELFNVPTINGYLKAMIVLRQEGFDGRFKQFDEFFNMSLELRNKLKNEAWELDYELAERYLDHVQGFREIYPENVFYQTAGDLVNFTANSTKAAAPTNLNIGIGLMPLVRESLEAKAP